MHTKINEHMAREESIKNDFQNKTVIMKNKN
jgi:hypothetical protein